MKCFHISDTHGHHNTVAYPEPAEKYDLLIHSGDLTPRGTQDECLEVIRFFNSLVTNGTFQYVVFTPGNHDWAFESPLHMVGLRAACDPRVHLLINEEVTINGFKIWGSPWTPKFGLWAFMYRRGESAKLLWDLIPLDADMVVTHGPARRKLDGVPEFNPFNERLIIRYTGCVELEERIQEVKPVVHMCGHIHEGWGHVIQGKTTYFNSSIMDERYSPVNKPQTFTLSRSDEGSAKCKLLFEKF